MKFLTVNTFRNFKSHSIFPTLNTVLPCFVPLSRLGRLQNMAATSHPEFNDHTESLDVAKAFSEAIHGKTVVVTGVNRKGIGFATSEAFVSTI